MQVNSDRAQKPAGSEIWRRAGTTLAGVPDARLPAGVAVVRPKILLNFRDVKMGERKRMHFGINFGDLSFYTNNILLELDVSLSFMFPKY